MVGSAAVVEDCEAGGKIRIVVDDRADDADSVSGSFTCGGANAACNEPKPFCNDDSETETAEASSGDCIGTSSDGEAETVDCTMASGEGGDDDPGDYIDTTTMTAAEASELPGISSIIRIHGEDGYAERCVDGECTGVPMTCHMNLDGTTTCRTL